MVRCRFCISNITKMKNTLQEMEQTDVITPAIEPTPLTFNMLAVRLVFQANYFLYKIHSKLKLKKKKKVVCPKNKKYILQQLFVKKTQ